MSETTNRLWVIIPTYNRSDDLIECLESLSFSGIKKEHIIVVDNCSQIGVLEQPIVWKEK
jgi:GT2 family glycosyltransferase